MVRLGLVTPDTAKGICPIFAGRFVLVGHSDAYAQRDTKLKGGKALHFQDFYRASTSGETVATLLSLSENTYI